MKGRASGFVAIHMVFTNSQSGLEKGLFFAPAAARTSERAPDIAAVLTAATQIASALAHLHTQAIMHGNLSLSSVLLADPPADSKSSINCKVRPAPAACDLSIITPLLYLAAGTTAGCFGK